MTSRKYLHKTGQIFEKYLNFSFITKNENTMKFRKDLICFCSFNCTIAVQTFLKICCIKYLNMHKKNDSIAKCLEKFFVLFGALELVIACFIIMGNQYIYIGYIE